LRRTLYISSLFSFSSPDCSRDAIHIYSVLQRKKLVAVHGLKGELISKHELGKKSSLKDVKAIFIEDKKDSFFPWFIETASKISR
jgi:hypothetical protein